MKVRLLCCCSCFAAMLAMQAKRGEKGEKMIKDHKGIMLVRNVFTDKQSKFGEKEKMIKEKEEIKKEEKPEYKNRVVFLRLSKSGEHIYAFNRDGALGEKVSSLIANVKDIRAVIDGKGDWAKVSVIEEKEDARS